MDDYGCTQPVINPEEKESLSRDAYLEDIRVPDDLSSKWNFVKTQLQYKLNVDDSYSKIELTPKLSDSKATFSIENNGKKCNQLISLIVGVNTVKITIVAEDGHTQITYTITITRSGASNAFLADITGIVLREPFESDKTSYTSYADTTLNSISILPRLSDANATYHFTKNSFSVSNPIPLDNGDNIIEINITAEDKVTTKKYYIEIFKWDATDASLKEIDGVKLNETFSSDTYHYTTNVEYFNNTLMLTPKPYDKYASYTIILNEKEVTSPLTLKNGSNSIEIITTSKDGEHQLNYHIALTKAYMIDDFESGDFSRNSWDFNHLEAATIITKDNSKKLQLLDNEKYYDGQTATMTLHVIDKATIQFDYFYEDDYKINSDFYFHINDEEKIRIGRGNRSETVKFVLEPGIQILKWRIGSHSDDRLYLDNIICLEGAIESQIVPPGKLSVTCSAMTIKIKWLRNNNADSYNVYRATVATGPYEKVNVAPVINQDYYQDENLTPDTTYYYKVTALYDGIESIKSEYIECKTKPRPETPKNFSATSITDKAVTLSWSADNGNGYWYYLYKSLSQDGVYNRIGTLIYYIETFTDEDVLPVTKYYYKISANKESDESLLSDPLIVQTPPEKPQNITSSTTVDSITIQWKASVGATSYKVYRADSYNGPYSVVSTDNLTALTYTDSNIPSATIYYYKISAVINSTEGSLSDPIRACSKLPVPANVHVKISTLHRVVIAWDAVAGADTYRLYRSDSVNETYEVLPGETISTSADDTELEKNKRYFYKVRARKDPDCYSNLSNAVEVSINENPTIAIPHGLNISAAYSQSFDIEWDKVAGATGYVLYYATSENGTYEVYGVHFTSLQYHINGYHFHPNRTYYFKVSAYNTDGEGLQSDQISASTTDALPVPSNLSVTGVGPDRVALGWGSVADATNYKVYVSSSSNGRYTLLRRTSQASYVHNHYYSTGKTLYYKVKALKGNYDISDLR